MDLRQPFAAEVAPGVHRIGTGLAAFYLLEESGRFTLVDGAFPKYFGMLTRFLDERSTGLEAIEAQVLTHHHPDHRGITNRVRDESGARVWIHQIDEPQLSKRQPPPRVPIWRPQVLKVMAHFFAHGIARTPPLLDASTFGDSEVLDVPGRPRARLVPGHTEGCCVFELGGGVLITGDALITVDFYTWDIRPSIPINAFNLDSHQALDSLRLIERLDVHTLLPGHGPVWNGPIVDAVAHARRIGVR